MSPSMEARIAEYVDAPTSPSLPPSLLAPWSYPLPQIPSPLSSPLPPPVPALLPLPSSPLPPLPALLFIPPVDRREDISEVELPPRKRLCSAAPTLRIRDTWVDPRETVEEVAPTTLEDVNTRVIELAVVQEHETQDIYAMIEDTQDRQTWIFQSVKALVHDRQYHYETARLLDQEALVSREAWAHFGQLSAALGQIQALQDRVGTHADDPKDADSSA
ncbi:hypothetical protein Tco_1305097 [Tanacetum coccineum]